MSAPTETALDFAGLLEVLGYTDGEYVSVCHEDTAGVFRATVGSPAGAPAYAAGLPDTASAYFGVNPVKRPRRKSAGRGKEADVARLAALVCDLDVKPGGCGSLDIARAIIAELSIILKTRPSAIVDSGHGLHPYWPIEDGQTNGDVTAARALLRRWGRLVEHIAGNHNAHADNVFDLTRVLRLPGSYNNKSVGNGSVPILVTAHADTGGPLSVAEVDERLTEVGVLERDDDRAAAATEISSPADWTFAAHTCDYVTKMIDGWPTDRPKPGGGRNPFVYDRHIRLFCALRAGCITEDDYKRARQILAELLTELVSTTEPRRRVRKFEIADMNRYGIRLVAAKTDEQARDELGDHHRKQQGAGAAQADPKPKLWNALDLEPAAQLRWLARGRIPYSVVSLLVGDEGLGKSLFWVWIVAIVSTGKAVDEFGIPERPAGDVIVVCTEDDWRFIVRPRLEVADADLTRIRVVCINKDGSGAPVFPRDLPIILDAKPKPVLVVVDAWLDTVPSSLKVKDPQDARLALHPWTVAATATGAAMLLLCHTNRVATGNPRDKYGITGELRKVARLTLFAQRDDHDQLLVGPEKNNLGGDIPAAMFKVLSIPKFTPTADDDGTVPLLVYDGDSQNTAGQQFAEAHANSQNGQGSADAMAWLATYLADGPKWVADIDRAGAAFSESKLKTAKRKLKVESIHDGATGLWFWRFPHHFTRTP